VCEWHASFMAAGGPGDDCLTDILSWNLPAFGEPHDSLIRDIVRFGGRERLEAGTQIGTTWTDCGRARAAMRHGARQSAKKSLTCSKRFAIDCARRRSTVAGTSAEIE
jgi:hypothetical protein